MFLNRKAKLIISISFLSLLSACSDTDDNNIPILNPPKIESKDSIIDKSGDSIETRYNPPKNYTRIKVEDDSYEDFLRKQKLKPYGSSVMYHNGREKTNHNVYDSVLDVDIGELDIHQCADAIMLLRAEYLYSKGEYDKINFHFVSGFLAEFNKWAEGYRINPDTGYYAAGSTDDYSYENFRAFMDIVFTYAGTLSMLKEATPVSPDAVEIGDIFLDKGHTVIIMDMAENPSGEKVFLLAQSYMPAQETQILLNRNDKKISPWYSLSDLMSREKIETPEWRFNIKDLMRYK